MKEYVKCCVYFAAKLLAMPFLMIFWLESWLLGNDLALRNTTELLALFPGITGRYLRRAFLSLVLDECPTSAAVGFGTTFSKYGARIGPNVEIGHYCSIGLATIEANVLIASGVYITSGAEQHGISDITIPIRDQQGINKRVTIGEGSWIGTNAIVMADVGKGTVVAAGAVVTKPLPDFVIAGGVPASIIRSRLDEAASPPC